MGRRPRTRYRLARRSPLEAPLLLRILALTAVPLLPLTFSLALRGEDPPAPPIASRTIAECGATILRLAADEKGAKLLLATDDYTARLFDVGKGAFAWRTEPFHVGATVDETVKRMLHTPRSIALSAKYAVVAVGRPAPECYAVGDGKSTGGFMSATIEFDKHAVSVLCDPRERWIWFVMEHGVVMRYAPEDGVRSYSRRTMKDGGQPRCAALDADDGTVAIGCADGGVRFADMSSAKIDEEKVLKTSAAALTAIDFAPKGALLTVGDEKGGVFVVHVPSAKTRHTLAAGDAAITSLAVHPKGKWFASGDAQGVVKLWSLDKGELLATLTADGATKVEGLAFVEQGKGLAAALGGKSVVVWDVAKL